MNKMKPMLPSLRERKRYIAYELHTKKALKKDVSEELVMQLRGTLGVFDSAKAGLMSVEYDNSTQKGILRVSTDKLNEARTALALQTGISGTQVLPSVLGISGTLNNARKKYMKEG